MEYILNWLVLLVCIAGIGVVAFVCCADLMRKPVRIVAQSGEGPAVAAVPETEEAPVGGGMELVYRLGDEVRHSQTVAPGSADYIGALALDMGPGVPLRYVRISGAGGSFSATNEDWESPVTIVDASGAETELSAGQNAPIEDGSELRLINGWTVQCRITEGNAE